METNSSKPSLKKNLFSTSLGMILYNLAIWSFSVLILRVLGSEMSGYYAIATSIGNTLYATALWGLRPYVVSDTSKRFSLSEYAAARVDAILLSTVILVGIACFSGYDSSQILILILYSLFKFVEAMIEMIDCFFQRKMEMQINATSMVLRSVGCTVLFAVILLLTHNLPLGLLGVTLFSLGIYYGFNRKKLHEKLRILPTLFHRSTGTILKHCFPVMGFELLAALVVALPRLVFERVGLRSDLGIYVTIYTLVVFLQLAINILIYTLAPYMAKAYNQKNKTAFRKQCALLFLGAIGLGLLAELAVLLFGQPVVRLIFGAEAATHTSYLYLGIVSGVTLSFTWMLSQIFVVVKQTQDQLICALCSTLVCLVLSFVLVNPSDCNSISLVLILTNLSFLIVAGFMLFRKRKAIIL